jgi:hypothetical protein
VIPIFFEEERDAWRPFEALDGLTDDQLAQPNAAAHDWSGRDLIAHIVAWLDDAVAAAGELASDESSEAIARSRREFAARGDEINAQIQATWRALPMTEVRRRLRETPSDLRARLAGVPEARWLTNADHFHFFHVYTIEHYDDHVADLAAILDAARIRA